MTSKNHLLARSAEKFLDLTKSWSRNTGEIFGENYNLNSPIHIPARSAGKFFTKEILNKKILTTSPLPHTHAHTQIHQLFNEF